MTEQRPAWRILEFVCSLPLIVLATVWLFFYPFMPLARDQGIFAWMGRSVANGLLPYRDAWEHKGPLTHVLYAIPQLVTHSSIGIRVLDMALIAVGILAAVKALAHLGLSRLRWLCAALIFTQYSGFWRSAQPDGWVSLGIIVVVATLFYDAGRLGWRAVVAMGAVAGLSLWVKPVYCVYALLPLAYAAIWRVDLRAGLIFALRTWGVMVLVSLPFVGWFAISGGFQELWEAYIAFNMESHGTIGNPISVSPDSTLLLKMSLSPWLLLLVIATSPLPFLVMVLMSFPIFVLQRRREGLVLLLVCLLGFAAVAVQGKYFDYHLYPVFAPLFIAGMAGISMAPTEVSLFSAEKSVMTRSLKLSFSVFAVLCLAISAWFASAKLVGMGADIFLGRQLPSAWYQSFNLRDYRYSEIREVASYIQGNSTPSDRMWVIGIDAGLYFEANRMPPTRFGFFNGIVFSRGALREKYHRQVVREVMASPPLYIVIADNADNPLFAGDAVFFLSRYPSEIGDLVASSYREVMRNRHFIVMRRTD